MNDLIYTYAKLSSKSVNELVLSHYKIDGIERCCYYVLGLHDNYFLETKHRKYIFRVYRNDWRLPHEIYFELEWLDYLCRQGCSVSAPVITRDEVLCIELNYPEGVRLAALFPYAEGVSPGNAITSEDASALGEAVAHIHGVANSFSTTHEREELNISYLLTGSIQKIDFFLDSEHREYLHSLESRLLDAMPVIERNNNTFGICIGDVSPSNFHINKDGRITLFDFDQCGYGYRVFEIAKFLSSAHNVSNKAALLDAFVSGYQRVRTLGQNELDSIPYFEMISMIWVMAIHAENAERIGYKWLDMPFWERKISTLKMLEAKL